MINKDLAESIYQNWINGNKTDVKKQLKNKSKLFIIDLIFFIAETTEDYKMACYEVYKMVEVD